MARKTFDIKIIRKIKLPENLRSSKTDITKLKLYEKGDIILRVNGKYRKQYESLKDYIIIYD